MKLLQLFFITTCLSAQTGAVIVQSFSGPDSHAGSAGGFGGYVTPLTLVDLNLGSAYASIKFGRVEPYVDDTSLSGVDIPLLTAVTGSTSIQTINIATTTGIPSTLVLGGGNNVFVIDGGLSTQETIPIYSIVDDTHISTVSLLSHSVGAKLRLVFSSVTKSLNVNMTAAGLSPGMSNVGLIRFGSLPAGVYDQYKIVANPVSACAFSTGSATAWYSAVGGGGGAPYPKVPQWDAGALTVQLRPTNLVNFETGPLTANTDPGTCMELQFLFTVTPEPLTTAIEYRLYWDYN